MFYRERNVICGLSNYYFLERKSMYNTRLDTLKIMQKARLVVQVASKQTKSLLSSQNLKYNNLKFSPEMLL